MKPTRVVVTVHGIRTYGQWQARLASLLAPHGIGSETYGYGYFSVLAFLLPPLRWLAVRRFRRELVRILERHAQAEVDLVAHSFGTHIVGFALRGLDRAHAGRIRTVLLSGSVLRSDFPWSGLIDAGLVQRVVNDCGVDDTILLLSQFLVLFTGMAGRVGFVGATNDRLANRFFRGGHSHYFELSAERDFVKANWLPLLLAPGQPAAPADERPPLGPVQGVLLALMQVAEPVKLSLYLGMPALLFFMFHVQPLADARATARFEQALRSQETQRADAERQKAEALADRQRALVAALSAEEAATRAQRERAEALAAQARAEAALAATEAESGQLLQRLATDRRRVAREAWVREARLIARLPPAERAAPFNQSLALLDDAFLFEFDRSRVTPESREVLDRFLEGMRAAGLDNTLVIRGRVGRFCTVSGADGTALAPDTTPVSQCGVGMGQAYALALSNRLAESFKAYLVSRGVSAQKVETEAYGLNPGGIAYPSGGYAKAWNLVAAQNNLVQLRLAP